MTTIKEHIRDLLSFYIETNYDNYKEENNITSIKDDQLKEIISNLYYEKRDHGILFIKQSLKQLLNKEEYPGDMVIDEIINSADDHDFNIHRIYTEIRFKTT